MTLDHAISRWAAVAVRLSLTTCLAACGATQTSGIREAAVSKSANDLAPETGSELLSGNPTLAAGKLRQLIPRQRLDSFGQSLVSLNDQTSRDSLSQARWQVVMNNVTRYSRGWIAADAIAPPFNYGAYTNLAGSPSNQRSGCNGCTAVQITPEAVGLFLTNNGMSWQRVDGGGPNLSVQYLADSRKIEAMPRPWPRAGDTRQALVLDAKVSLPTYYLAETQRQAGAGAVLFVKLFETVSRQEFIYTIALLDDGLAFPAGEALYSDNQPGTPAVIGTMLGPNHRYASAVLPGTRIRDGIANASRSCLVQNGNCTWLVARQLRAIISYHDLQEAVDLANRNRSKSYSRDPSRFVFTGYGLMAELVEPPSPWVGIASIGLSVSGLTASAWSP